MHIGVGPRLLLALHGQHLVPQHDALCAVRPLHVARVALLGQRAVIILPARACMWVYVGGCMWVCLSTTAKPASMRAGMVRVGFD